MAISVFLIAVLSYAVGLVDVAPLVCRYALEDEAGSRTDYPSVYRRHGLRGAAFLLGGDLLRAIITVLIGGMLLKGAGFPSVGKLLAMLFSLIALAMPLTDGLKSRRELVYPALTLLFVDWRLFLVCVVAGVIVMALTGSRALMAAAGAVAMPLFSLIFGCWWLKVVLAVFCAMALIHCFSDEIRLPALRGFAKGSRRSGAGNPEKPEDSGRNR